MPAPLNLTGRKFGKLTVLRRGERVKFGRWQASWICQCDCGNELAVPQDRLPHRAYISSIIDRCEDCRSHPCEICGTPIPRKVTRKTCSDECRKERRQRYQRRWHRERLKNDPDFWQAHKVRRQMKWREMTAEEKLADGRKRRQKTIETYGRDYLNDRSMRAHRKRMEDKEYREKMRRKNAQWAAQNREKQRKYVKLSRQRKKEQQAAMGLAEAMEKLKNIKGNSDDGNSDPEKS